MTALQCWRAARRRWVAECHLLAARGRVPSPARLHSILVEFYLDERARHGWTWS